MWPRLHNVVIGLWLISSPAVFHYGPQASVNNEFVAPIVLACALIGLHEVARGLRWVNLVIGVWLLIAPWILGYSVTPMVNGMCTGALLVCGSLVPGRRWMAHGRRVEFPLVRPTSSGRLRPRILGSRSMISWQVPIARKWW